jgi:phosphoribosylformylglycinamidine synthase subunit PurSL
LLPQISDLRDDAALFSESPSRFVITVRAQNVAAFEASLYGLACAAVGHVTETGTFRVVGRAGAPLIDADINRLKAAWQKPLNW